MKQCLDQGRINYKPRSINLIKTQLAKMVSLVALKKDSLCSITIKLQVLVCTTMKIFSNHKLLKVTTKDARRH